MATVKIQKKESSPIPEKPSPSKRIEWIKGENGLKIYCYDGYLYFTEKMGLNNRHYLACRRKTAKNGSCKARAVEIDGEVKRNDIEHNHDRENDWLISDLMNKEKRKRSIVSGGIPTKIQISLRPIPELCQSFDSKPEASQDPTKHEYHPYNDHEWPNPYVKHPQTFPEESCIAELIEPAPSQENCNSNFGGDSSATVRDLDFFRSIIPDIANFSCKQKRRFKREVLMLIDKIEEEDA